MHFQDTIRCLEFIFWGEDGSGKSNQRSGLLHSCREVIPSPFLTVCRPRWWMRRERVELCQPSTRGHRCCCQRRLIKFSPATRCAVTSKHCVRGSGEPRVFGILFAESQIQSCKGIQGQTVLWMVPNSCCWFFSAFKPCSFFWICFQRIMLFSFTLKIKTALFDTPHFSSGGTSNGRPGPTCSAECDTQSAVGGLISRSMCFKLPGDPAVVLLSD